ncbi:MAG: 1-acyl-sn-glycerol-3-phosphate acyltransferase [Melioribacteraceae bacterium]|nr:1-acyl-sn-glycerol-3-phosphate acyltransferase [Melioribacteraceae bacterium]
MNNEISIQSIIEEQNPSFKTNNSSLFKKGLIRLLERILYINEINKVVKQNESLKNFEFIDEVFDHLNFSFSISNKDMKKIPSEGRLIIAANHPIGSLDSLALLKAVSEIRTDVKIIANQILTKFENIKDLLLPYQLDSLKIQRQNILSIQEALQNESAVIIFPAAEVSRLKLLKILDSKWHKGAVYFSKKI